MKTIVTINGERYIGLGSRATDAYDLFGPDVDVKSIKEKCKNESIAEVMANIGHACFQYEQMGAEEMEEVLGEDFTSLFLRREYAFTSFRDDWFRNESYFKDYDFTWYEFSFEEAESIDGKPVVLVTDTMENETFEVIYEEGYVSANHTDQYFVEEDLYPNLLEDLEDFMNNVF